MEPLCLDRLSLVARLQHLQLLLKDRGLWLAVL